jgi:hypothetical protein
VLKEDAYKMSARNRRTVNMQLYITSTNEETPRWVGSNTTQMQAVLGLNFAALTKSFCSFFKKVMYLFFLKKLKLFKNMLRDLSITLLSFYIQRL